MQNTFGASSSRYGQVLIASKPQGDGPSQPPPQKVEKSKDDRVARACKTCRKRKVRCSGDLPRCNNCQANSLECHYEPARRDRLKEATQLNHTLVALLRDLSERVSDGDRNRIENALDEAEDDLIVQAPDTTFMSLGKRDRRGSARDDIASAISSDTAHGEAYVTASVGSNEDLDNLDEDLMRNSSSRATGYVGQNSEVQWLRSAQRQMEHPSAEPYGQPHGPPGAEQAAANVRSAALRQRQDNAREGSREGSMRYINDSTFYLDSDSEDLELDMAVDPNAVPIVDVAERLFRCYLETVHSSFPLVPTTFIAEFQSYVTALRANAPFHLTSGWRAQMNLIFAIAAKYSHLIDAEWKGDKRDHVVYMLRATNLLGMKDVSMLFSMPDLRLVQTTSSLAFYFLVVGRVSRAWIMIGISIRLALALGLHLRNEDPNATEGRKDILIHTWWSLHSIECLVSTVTGRPPIIAFEDCTVILPYGSPGDSHENLNRPASRQRMNNEVPPATRSNYGSASGVEQPIVDRYTSWHIKVSILSQKALFQLYSPRTASRTWEEVQGSMTSLLQELDEWADEALQRRNSSHKGKQKADTEREHFLLSTDYWSLRMLVTRPCLCRIERRIRKESDTSASFNAKMGKACVDAALQITRLFPDRPDLEFLYTQAPWWSVVHLLMQAFTVLLLNKAYEYRKIGWSDETATETIRKLICWLRAMKYSDPVAARAHDVIWKILKNCAPSLQPWANDVLAPFENPGPVFWGNHGLKSPMGYEETAQTPQHGNFPPPLDNARPFGETSFGQHQQHQQNQPLDTLPGYQENVNARFPPDEPVPSIAFGTPFFTGFEQGASVIQLQDLWGNTASGSSFDPGIGSMHISQQQPEEEEILQNPYTSQQQQQQQHHY